MTGEEAVAYIHSYGWETRAPGLDRIRELLRRLGEPQRDLRFIHVAGTNGKGSVCACLASVLEAAGYRVGLNTSPHLERFHERIRVNGKEISGEDLGAVMDIVRPGPPASSPNLCLGGLGRPAEPADGDPRKSETPDTREL